MPGVALHSLDPVGKLWPCRAVQIQKLFQLLQYGYPVNVFVHGGPSTGKTGVVKDVAKALSKHHAYVSCIELSKPKQIAASILTQLKGRKRDRENGFQAEYNCMDVRDFVISLADICRRLQDTPIIVLDDADRIADDNLLSVILRLRELSGVSCSVVLISRLAWGSLVFARGTCSVVPPLPLFFPQYREIESKQVLSFKRPAGVDAQLYNNLVSLVHSTLWRKSRTLSDLHTTTLQLLPHYLHPITTGELEATATAALYAAFKPILVKAAESFVPGVGCPALKAGSVVRPTASAANAAPLDFELPYMSKFLLLAAYLASHNKPTLDRRLFGTGKSKRVGASGSDRQAEEAAKACRAGPHPFPRERLLALFWALLRAENEDDMCLQPQDLLAADVSMNLTTLTSLRLITLVHGDVLEGALYRCNISHDMAKAVAQNVNMKLHNYLYYV